MDNLTDSELQTLVDVHQEAPLRPGESLIDCVEKVLELERLGYLYRDEDECHRLTPAGLEVVEGMADRGN